MTAVRNGQPETQVGTREAIVNDLFRFVRQHQERFNEAVSGLGLSGPQAKALAFLESVSSMRELALRLHCDASYATILINQLVALKMVRRIEDKNDRRRTRVATTVLGQRICNQVHELMYTVPELDALDDADLAQLGKLACRLVDG